MLNFEEIVTNKTKNGNDKKTTKTVFSYKTGDQIFKPKPTLKKTIIKNLMFLIILAIGYIYNPVAINFKNSDIYLFVFVMLIILYVLNYEYFITKMKKVIYILLTPLALIMLVGGFFEIQTFAIWDNGSGYYNQIGKIENLDQKASKKFQFDLNKNYVVNKDMALKIADKKMGVDSLSSQYSIDNATLQKIKYQNETKLFWVVNLKYNNFWSQFNNKHIGNVILVDANKPQEPAILLTNNNKNEKFNIRLSNSGFLDQKLERMVQLKNPEKMLTDYSFELDDDLTPHYIVTNYVNKRGFAMRIVKGIVDINLNTNEMKYYTKDKVPNWVDRVNPISLVREQISNNGEYVHGIWNWSNKDKFQISNDENNFIYLDDEAFFISGITSLSSDKSLIGIIAKSLKDDKTYKIQIDGAVESSAMKSAEGKVQNYGYKATSPIIIHNQNWKYLVPLVDNENLIKAFALVDIQNYQNVKLFDTIDDFVANQEQDTQSSPTSPNQTPNSNNLKEQLLKQIDQIQKQLNALKESTKQMK